ncbi:hypothetical protein BH18VER1_BH18VER1_15150 [soil metagenome]
MKKITIAAIAAGLLPIVGFAQTPPAPPIAPVPPAPGVAPVPPHPRDHDRERESAPKVPVTFLGVETSAVPRVVSEQLGLTKGFGLVVDYVVPDGPAAAAGVQANDILKMFNDQILMEPDQLAKLVRSNPEGTTVTLTVLRKGAETKLSAKLGKREVTQRRGWDDSKHRKGFGAVDFGNMDEQMQKLRDGLGNMNFSFNEESMEQIREQAREASDVAREAARGAARAVREMRIAQRDNGAVKTTRIDMGKAQILYNDAQGELKIENVDGKKVLTAKDPQGRLVFSGPVGTKEELDKLPVEVRQRYDALEQKDLPNVVPPNVVSRSDLENDDAAADAAADAEDENIEDDDGDDEDSNPEAVDAVSRISNDEPKSLPYRRVGIDNVLI